MATRAEVVPLTVRAMEAEEQYSEALDEVISALTKRVSGLAERFDRWRDPHRAGHADAEELVGRGIPGLLEGAGSAEGHAVRSLQSDPSRAVRGGDRGPTEVAVVKLLMREEIRRKN